MKFPTLFSLAFILIFPAVMCAQNSVEGSWKGEWSNNIGHYFTFELTLKQGGTNTVEGAFTWTIVESPYTDEKPKLGMTAVEYVRGQFDPKSRKLSLTGYKKEDPNRIIGLDYYTLTLTENGRILEGPTRNNNTWKGVFYGVKIVPKQDIVPTRTSTDKLEGREVVTTAEIETDADTLSLLIWDNSKEDGDIISLNINGVWILREHTVSLKKLNIPLILSPGKNQLILHAENLGRIPPNTAAITVMQGDKPVETLILNSDMGKSEAIEIEFNP